MRPQGFLGHHFARHHEDLLQVPEDPTVWTGDHALHAMSLLGTDLLGNLILGEPACRQRLERVQADPQPPGVLAVDDAIVPKQCEQLAARALAQGIVGSSAGGEFPKFEAVRRLADGQVRHVLVKFSGADDSAGTQRWSDLLVCEPLASLVPSTPLGVQAATSRIHRFGGRTFLEVERFDRHDLPARGLELPPREFRPRPPLPAERGHWDAAARAATVCWQAVAGDARIGAAFRATGAANA